MGCEGGELHSTLIRGENNPTGACYAHRGLLVVAHHAACRSCCRVPRSTCRHAPWSACHCSLPCRHTAWASRPTAHMPFHAPDPASPARHSAKRVSEVRHNLTRVKWRKTHAAGSCWSGLTPPDCPFPMGYMCLRQQHHGHGQREPAGSMLTHARTLASKARTKTCP